MGSVLAIISKAQFEKLAGKKPVLGSVLALSEYTSTHAALEPLAEGGALYLTSPVLYAAGTDKPGSSNDGIQAG